jgi:hypothetical protein
MAPYLWRFEKGMEFGPGILIRLLYSFHDRKAEMLINALNPAST